MKICFGMAGTIFTFSKLNMFWYGNNSLNTCNAIIFLGEIHHLP